ncbi:MAG: hypothetical protein ACFE96_07710 [Candidatus Hermodarchaeota archaeon]
MGLSALIMIFYAAIITLFLKDVVFHLGEKFVKVHHAFVLTGFILLLIHGITYVVTLSSGLSIEPWTIFSMIGDTCAIIAIIAAIKRKSWTSIWRYVHMLMYATLVLITLHGIFGGTDFSTPTIFVIYISMLAVLVVFFILKRWQLVIRKMKGRYAEKLREK